MNIFQNIFYHMAYLENREQLMQKIQQEKRKREEWLPVILEREEREVHVLKT